MARKKNCRRTPEEQAIHREAVRLRSMTDRQLVERFHRAAEPEMNAKPPRIAQDGPEAAGATRDTNALMTLLDALAEGRCKGIKGGTAFKVSEFAKELGLL